MQKVILHTDYLLYHGSTPKYPYQRFQPGEDFEDKKIACDIRIKKITCDQIHGELSLFWTGPLICYGLVVELIGRLSTGSAKEMEIFANQSDPSTVLKGKSINQVPVITQATTTGKLDDSYKLVLKSCGLHTFPFTLQIPKIKLPSSLSNLNGYGEVQYYIVVFKMNQSNFQHISATKIKFPGYLNLCHLKNSYPIKSEFSGNEFSMLLQSPRVDYILGESIHFTVSFTNPKLLSVLCLSVKLVRVVTFSSIALSKSLSEIVEVFVGKKSQAQEFSIGGAFSGNKVKIISYSGPNLKVRYYIKCEAILKTREGKNTTAICEINEVVVGTTRKSSQDHDLYQFLEPNVNDNVAVERANQRGRSSSLAPSLFPPQYSQLSSRATSIMSFETLPPHYGDLCKYQSMSLQHIQ